MKLLAAAWRGEERLWRAYWLLGIPLPLLGFVYALGTSRYAQYPVVIFMLSVALTAAIGFWGAVVWRCSKNVESKLWAWAAKTVVIVNFAGVTLEWLKALT